jgi:signal transduction histidine kinase
LISNALKFTPENGFISINYNLIDDLNIISITDNGLGMTYEQISNLFKIDINVSTPGTNEESGTGLGLILCKELIEKLNGKIWAESQPDKGSTFYIAIPNSK